MAKFALQDQNLFYGVYEAEDKEMAIFHLLTRDPFCITSLKYDSYNKMFNYSSCVKCSSLPGSVGHAELITNKINAIICDIDDRSFRLDDEMVVLWKRENAVEVDAETAKSLETQGYDLWDHKNTTVCPMRR